MLVLTRRPGQEFLIGDDISVKVVRIANGQVRIGISAPRDVSIVRGELPKRTQTEGDPPAEGSLQHGRR